MVRNTLTSVKNSLCASSSSFGERLKVGYICLGLVFLLISCSNSEFEYSNNSCYFVFDNAQHNDPTLTSALIATSHITRYLLPYIHKGWQEVRF